jgi:DNA-binding response OmpR family regulator
MTMSEETHTMIIEETGESIVNITLLNLAVTGSDGIAALRELINNDPSAIVVLLIPEHITDPNIIVEAVRAGAKAYIKKPASGEDLKGRLTTLLGRRQKNDYDKGDKCVDGGGHRGAWRAYETGPGEREAEITTVLD